ncbi:MAG: TonB-dependent receptor [Muribaculaceae bacterium]|nr:TonB-dependent receptor [Muribaculaceae bacterium]
MNKRFLLPLGLVVALGWSAYSAVLTGSIRDTQGESLPGAVVSLRTLPDSTMAGGTIADENGEFIVRGLRPGNYNVTFSMVGLTDLPYRFDVHSDNDTIRFDNVTLAENSVLLNEVTVTAVRPAVVAKEDTLEYNAGSYHTSPNATVEDLLKKLPGVEVGSDGSISSGGKSITKILVNGKEYFNDDPQAATKNLTADMVEKVQVIDKKSDLAILTGVDDGEEETVINLTVKKDMQNGWFGTVKGGYGTSGRYEGSLNANYFKNGNQLSIIGGANNINEMGFGDMGRARFRDFGGNGGITTSQRLGINFNVGNDDTFRVGGNVFYSHSSRDSRQRSETQFLFPDSVSYQNSGNRTLDRGHNLRADLRMQWKIDPENTIDFRPRFTLNYRNAALNDSSSLFYDGGADRGMIDVNAIRNLQNNRGLSYQADGDLIFNHNFSSHPGRSFSAQLKYSLSNTRQHGTTWSDIEYYLMSDDSETLFRYLNNHQWNNTLEGRLTWTEPLGDASRGNFLNIAYRISSKWSNADKLTYDVPFALYDGGELPTFTGVPDGATEQPDLSNRFRNKFLTQELQIGYKKVSKSLNLEAGILFSPSMSKSEDLINSMRNIPTRWVWNVGPFARIRLKFWERGSININYRARTSQPSLTQLQPVPDVSDPLNVIVGNPDLKPTFTQSLMARFSNYNTNRQQSVAAMVNASYSLNSIVNYTVTDPTTGARTTSYRNVDGNLSLMGMFMLNQPFRNRAWRINTRLSGRYSTSPGYINGDYNRSGNLILSPSVGMTFSTDIFQVTLNPTYTFNMATNSLAMQQNRYIHSYGFTGDASLYLPFGLDISTDIDYSYNTGYGKGFQRRQALWNATASYSILKDRSLTFSVRVYDILGQRQNISRTVSANQIVDSEHNDLTRYVMFGVAWRFSTFKKGTSANGEDRFDDGLPPQGAPPREGPGNAPQGPPPGGFGGGGFGGGRGGF